MKFQIYRKVVGPFQCNCWILVCPQTGKTVLVDPGDEPEQILQQLKKIEAEVGRPLSIEGLFHTHAHLDHIGGTRKIREAEPLSRIYLHKQDEFLYQILQQQGARFGFTYEDPHPVDTFIEHRDTFTYGELKLEVLHTPGHSPGSVCFRLQENQQVGLPEILFTGDTLFQGSVGRTDLWGGDSDLMFRNIRQQILSLPGEVKLFPGHGGTSTVLKEKTSNPFLR